MAWTDERVEKLRALWNEGWTASQIAGELGGVTRNAVIGKVHRLGLAARTAKACDPEPAPSRDPATVVEPGPAPVVEETTSPSAIVEESAPDEKDVQVETPFVERNDAPVEQFESDEERTAATLAAEVEQSALKLSLLDLNERTCKWPIGDPSTDDFYFCGHRAAPGKPYCEAHAALAYQPMSSRRDRDKSRRAPPTRAISA